MSWQLFKFNERGPHPEVHCRKLHWYVCCICKQTQNVFHEGPMVIGDTEVEIQELKDEQKATKESPKKDIKLLPPAPTKNDWEDTII